MFFAASCWCKSIAYRADEFLTEMALAKEFGYKIPRFPSRA